MIANSTSVFLIDALVFDAYGTLFDTQSVAATVERLFPGRGAALADLWRSKQLEYTWLQSLMQSPMQRREDFAAVTAHALDYAAEALGLALAGAARHRLLDAYLDLSAYADAAPTLARLGPRPRLILSVDAAGIYKPSPRVYQLALDHLKFLPIRIGFVSANAWDAIGAKAFGFTSFWINRNRAPLDRHGPKPDAVLNSLSELPPLVGSV